MCGIAVCNSFPYDLVPVKKQEETPVQIVEETQEQEFVQ
jgi:adenine/guanine phosphoribosyltransferase-like PRPP-binding protein